MLLVGAGPGDPELLTLKAVRALKTADVILYDRLAGTGVLEHARREVELIPVGKSKGDHSVPQEKIQELMIERALAGQTVVRLKGGDPLVFGRAGEEIAALRQAGIEVEIIPGITAGLAAAAILADPAHPSRHLAQRDLRLGPRGRRRGAELRPSRPRSARQRREHAPRLYGRLDRGR